MYYTHEYCIGVHHAEQEIFFRFRAKFLRVSRAALKHAENAENIEPER